MVTTLQIGRKLARIRAHKATAEAARMFSMQQADAPENGADGVTGVWANRSNIEDSADYISTFNPGALAELMEQWREEDHAMTEEEAAQADRDLEEFKTNMNANRAMTGERPVFK